MNAPDKAVAFEALMKDTPGFDHYDSGYDKYEQRCDEHPHPEIAAHKI